MFLTLIGLCACNGNTPPEKLLPGTKPEDPTTVYFKTRDVWFMTFMVAFLMMFIKRYEWGTYVATLLAIMSSFLCYVFLRVVVRGLAFDARIHAEGVVCAITCSIAVGVFLGSLKHWQYILAGVIFALSFHLVEILVISGDVLIGVVDPGGAICVHMFAAYWGLGVAMVIRDKRLLAANLDYTTHSIGWVWLATSTLWLFWPSFVTLFYKGELAVEGQVACIMAGLGSFISAFITESIIRRGTINTLVFAYALLGGCIGVSSALFICGPWGGLLIGSISGIVSELSFNFLDLPLGRLLGIKDVTGVHNLHGVCSWVSVICGAISCKVKGFEGGWTFVGGLIGFGVACLTGAICGVILRLTRCTIPDDELLMDKAYFDFPDLTAPKEANSSSHDS
jgi:ammonium transporter Rh